MRNHLVIFISTLLLIGCNDSDKLDLSSQDSFKTSLLKVASKLNDNEKKILQYVLDSYRPSLPKTDEEIIRASKIHNLTAEKIIELGTSELKILKNSLLKQLEVEKNTYSKRLKRLLGDIEQPKISPFKNPIIEQLSQLSDCVYRNCNEGYFSIEVLNPESKVIMNPRIIMLGHNKTIYLSSDDSIQPESRATIKFSPLLVEENGNEEGFLTLVAKYLLESNDSAGYFQSISKEYKAIFAFAAYISREDFETMTQLLEEQESKRNSKELDLSVFDDSYVSLDKKLANLRDDRIQNYPIYDNANLLFSTVRKINELTELPVSEVSEKSKYFK